MNLYLGPKGYVFHTFHQTMIETFKYAHYTNM